MTINLHDMSILDRYKLLTATIYPRPIAWIGSKGKNGVDNLAPFSFFNIASVEPPILSVSFSKKPDFTEKDSLHNLLDNHYFSLNVVDYDLLDQMHRSGEDIASIADEFEHVGLEKIRHETYDVPMVKAAKVRYLCKFREKIDFGENSSSTLVLADILSVDYDESLNDFPKFDPKETDLVGRAGGPYYTHSRDVIKLDRKS